MRKPAVRNWIDVNGSQVHELLPRLLLPVLPQLQSQLHGEEAKGRTRALKLLGSLFTKPESGLAEQYPDLFKGVLTRLKDSQVGDRGLLHAHRLTLSYHGTAWQTPAWLWDHESELHDSSIPTLAGLLRCTGIYVQRHACA